MASDYCYPVLSENSDDYKEESSFSCKLDTKSIGNTVHIDAVFNLTDETILNLIRDGSAEYSLLLKCPKSSYRSFFSFGKDSWGIDINGSDIDVGGRVEAVPAVISVYEIDNYENNNLNSEYEGSTISIPKHGVLAIAIPQMITVKRRDPFRAPESVVKFDVSDEQNQFEIRNWYDEEDDYITIYLPRDLHEKYVELPKEIKEVFSAVYVIPIIADIIQRYWIDEKVECEYRWYGILSERMALAYGDKKIDNSYEMSTMIFRGFSEEVLNNIYFEFTKERENDENSDS